MRSLRGRLTVWLLAGTGLLLLAGGLLLNRVISTQLRQEFDAALITKARSLMTLTEQQDKRVWLEFADKIMPEFEAKEKPDYFQLWLVQGAVLERSRSLGTRDLPRSGGQLDQILLRDLTLPDGRRGREAEITFNPRAEEEEDRGERERDSSLASPATGGATATLAVARGREDLEAFLWLLHTILTLGVVGLLAGIAFLVKTVVGIGLRPLDDLARRLETMDAASLDKALEVASAPVELVPVIHHLRGLLGRLDESFQRERAFSANLAHELRTPLAELRTLVDVALKWPGDSAASLDSLREARDIGFQMERVVVNLLALARCEGGQHAVRASEVSLPELATSCWAAVAPQAEERGISFKQEIPEDLTAVTDGEKLSLIVSNLFSNAVAHGSPGSLVTCSAEAEGGELALRVSNATDSLTPEDLPWMFDRFWRKDPARSDSRHAGLGLALVSALCELLQLRKQARLEEGLFEITLKGSLLIVPSSKAC